MAQAETAAKTQFLRWLWGAVRCMFDSHEVVLIDGRWCCTRCRQVLAVASPEHRAGGSGG